MDRLLVVEDDAAIGQALTTGLLAGGYDVRWARTGGSALELAVDEPVDLVVLDVGLPDLDGYEVCRELRRLRPQAVIVMLTARQEEMDVVTGLESGADDYLTKPFRLAELLARVRAHLRRAAADDSVPRTVVLGSLAVDVRGRIATVGGVDVVLRAREFDLLSRLAAGAGTAVSREDLMHDVWDENWFGSTKTLDVHMAALRRRLADAAATDPEAARHLPVIVTLRGFGYRLQTA